MKKTKCLVAILAIIMLIFTALPVVSNAADISATREIVSNNGSMRFTFSGLELDTSHNYQFALTRTAADEITDWFEITDYTDTTAVVEILTTTRELRDVVNLTDTGYVTIKDTADDSIVVEDYSVNLQIPYLMVTDKTVIENGTEFESTETQGINVGIRNANISEAYYQYVEITDQDIIDRYLELKESEGDMTELQDMLTTSVPTSNWSSWAYWNGHGADGLNGYGYPERTISAPDDGLYYLWVYFSGDNVKNVYGYVIVDNLGDVTPGDDNNNDNNNNSNNTNNNDDNSDSPLFTDEEDKTVAPGEIPQTGQAIIAIVAIVIFAVLGSIVYRKHRNMRDIK